MAKNETYRVGPLPREKSNQSDWLDTGLLDYVDIHVMAHLKINVVKPTILLTRKSCRGTKSRVLDDSPAGIPYFLSCLVRFNI